MKYLGDLTEDQTIDFKFSTHKADGTPITLAGTPVVKVYKANATDSETATGVTLSVDFDSVTGLHNLRIDTSADAFYAVANDYSVVITAGTVDGVSVVGAVLATFSIENRFIEPAAMADAILDRADGVETGKTLRQALRIMAAILAGKVSGAGSGTETFTGLDGATDRVEVAVDEDGNRTAVTFDP